MSTNGVNTSEEAGITECDGEKVVTMMDVLQEQEEFEEDANAVLGASDDKNCTYSKGYIKRQAIYACLTCCADAKNDPTKRAGVCLACSLTCHENHDLVELYTKRNFRCDCGNPKFNSHPCQFTPEKTELNEDNKYNQNFSGLYCICHRPYPDPESTIEDEMIQCIICEDWLHSSHLDAVVPTNEQYAEMICKGCMEKNEFIHDYSDFAVNNELEDIDITVNSTTTEKNGTSELTITNGGDNKSSEANNDNEIKDKMDVDIPEEKQTTNKETESQENVLGNESSVDEDNKVHDTVNALTENAMDTDKTEEELTLDKKETESSDETIQTETSKDKIKFSINKSENNPSEILNNDEKVSNDIVTNTKEISDSVLTEKNVDQNINNEDAKQPEINCNNKDCDNEKEPAGESISNVAPSNMDLTEGDPDNHKIINTTDSDDINMSTNENQTEESQQKEMSDCTEKSNEETANKEKDEESSQYLNVNGEQKNTNTMDESGDKDVPEKSSCKENSVESEQKESEVEAAQTGSEVEAAQTGSEVEAAQTESEIEAADKKGSELGAAQNENEVVSAPPESEIEAAQKGNQIDGAPKESAGEPDSADSAIDSEPMKTGTENLTSEKEASLKNNETEDHPALENDCKQNDNDESFSKDDKLSEDIELTSNVQENKRKLSTDQCETDEIVTKKAKIDECNKHCVRPKGIKRRFKGATFWPSNFRQKLCTCSECISMYKDLSVLFLIDPEDTVTAYETLGKEKINGAPASQYEKGLLALSSLDRIQQINALTEYNKMRDKLLDFLKSFKDRKEIVKEEDIKAFFAGMKPKREPDGVYFCR